MAALKHQGHALAVFHRGTTAAPAGVEIRGNRKQLNANAQELKRFAPDVVIDLVISSGPQAEELMNIFRGATGLADYLLRTGQCIVNRGLRSP